MGAAHRGDAFPVAVAAFDEAVAEDALHVGITVVAERLREAHHRRRLDFDLGSRGGDRVEGDFLRPLERVARDALQLARQVREAPADLGLELVVVAGGSAHGWH